MDAAGEKRHRGLSSGANLQWIRLTQIRMHLSGRVLRYRRYRGRARLYPPLGFDDPEGMLEDKFPYRLGLRSHWSPDEDGEVGVDGDAECPAAGTAVAVRDVGSIPRDEVGKAFRHARVDLIAEGSVSGLLIHRALHL